MTRDEWEQIAVAIRAAWPDSIFADDTSSTYYAVLADLPYPDARMAVIQSIGLSADGVPKPGDLLIRALANASAQPAGIAIPANLNAAPSTQASDMSPRMRRLTADWEAVREAFSGHPLVTVEPIGALPPEKYRVTYHLRGIALQGDQPVHSNMHQVEIHLPSGYPREQPLVLPLTPIFHPNVSDRFCIADDWFAGEGLMDVITRLADIIQYKSFNPKSYLNKRAAKWAEQNPEIFPIGTDELGRGEVVVSIKGAQ
ncbi:MAG: ubiquitin-conjugating enzyme E2 [Actinomycetes bacterium]